MTQPSRAPAKNVATALANDAAKIAQIVQSVVNDEAAEAASITHTVSVRESGPAPAVATPRHTLTADAPEAPEAADVKPEPAKAMDGLVLVRNGHCASVCGIEPGQRAWIPREAAAKHPWAWR